LLGVRGSVVCIVATLGFDEKHVVRSLIRIGFRDVDAIKLLVPRREHRDEFLEKKVGEAFSKIKSLAEMAEVKDVTLVEVPIKNFVDGVATIRGVLRKCLRSSRSVVLSLGGGMRALVVESLIAALSLPERERRNVKIFVELESGEGFVEFDAAVPLSVSLSSIEADVLRFLASCGNASLGDIATKLGLPRSTAWKALDKLASLGLVERSEGLYVVTEYGKLIAKIIEQDSATS